VLNRIVINILNKNQNAKVEFLIYFIVT